MRFLAWTLTILLILAPAYAGNVHLVMENDAAGSHNWLLKQYNQKLNGAYVTGACTINAVTDWISSQDPYSGRGQPSLGSDTGNEQQSIVFPGTSAGSCQTLGTTKHPYVTTNWNQYNQRSLAFQPAGATYSASSAEFLGMITALKSSSSILSERDRFITAAMPSSSFDTRPFPSASFPFFTQTVCGFDADINYTKNTATPITAVLTATDYYNSQECGTLYNRATGNPGGNADRAFFTTEKATEYYTLPLPYSCTGYTLNILDSDHNGIPTGTTAMTPIISGTGVTTGYIALIVSPAYSPSTFTASLSLNAQQRVKEIGVSMTRGGAAHGNGGVSFTINCDGIPEPDSAMSACNEATPDFYDWNDTVNAAHAGSACCGDDANDNNLLFTDVDARCVKQPNNQWVWQPAAAACSGDWLAGAPATTACCTATTIGARYGFTTPPDAAICALVNVSGTMTPQWVLASQTTDLFTVTPNNVTVLASDGAQFLTCRYQNIISRLEQVPPLRQSAGACGGASCGLP